MDISIEKLHKILEQHKKWLNNDPNGVRADLSYTNLQGANLNFVDLQKANLTHANLSGTSFIGANLHEAELSFADMRKVDLADADLSNVNLFEANLTNANMLSTNLANAVLIKANLEGANMPETDLSKANLTMANLANANLCEANLKDTNFTNTNLHQTDLTGTILGNARIPVSERNNEKKAIFVKLATEGDKTFYEADCKILDYIVAARTKNKLRGPIASFVKDYQTIGLKFRFSTETGKDPLLDGLCSGNSNIKNTLLQAIQQDIQKAAPTTVLYRQKGLER